MSRTPGGGPKSLNLKGDPAAVVAELERRGVDVRVGPAPRLAPDSASDFAPAPVRPAGEGPPPRPAETKPRRPAAAGDPAAAVRTDRPRRWVVEWDVPARLASESNIGRKLKARIDRKAGVKALAAAHAPGALSPVDWAAGWRLTVTLTRYGSKPLDPGNLEIAFKAVQDIVAAWVGVDDAHPLVRWAYRQRAAFAPGVRVRVVGRAPSVSVIGPGCPGASP